MASTSRMLLKLSTWWKMGSMLGRGARRGLHEAERNDEKVRSVIMPALEVGRVAGQSDVVEKQGEEAITDLMDHGIDNVLVAEEDVEAIELRIEESVDNVPELLLRVRQAVMRSKELDPRARQSLLSTISDCEHELYRMYDQMLKDIGTVYTSVNAASRSGDQDTHRLLAEKLGPQVFALAEASKQLFWLKSDRKQITRDVEAIKEVCEILDEEIAQMGRRHQAIPKLLERIEDQRKGLVKHVKALLEHVLTNFRRFVIIMQVCVTYFFAIRGDEHKLKAFFQGILGEGFSEEKYHHLHDLLARQDLEVEDRVNRIANVIISMRHTPQRNMEMAKKAA